MKGYLLDTHALIWWNADEGKLGAAARAVFEEADQPIFASAVNAFEIATKHRLGKLPVAHSLLQAYHASLNEAGFMELSIQTEHALRAGTLQIEHRDPFDRLLIAQALVENLTLLSNERLFDRFGVNRVWE
ncbi:MAG TPA: type II toxin-antitoxin system VapC family toxin [Novosphingobium sp.]|nr:type II toxin-antitoxin system VapC family toxin [Novosphingobium sp.]